MPAMRVTALAEFFFPSSRSKKAKRSSRPRPLSVNISRNHGANIYPCVWMAPSPESSRAPSDGHTHSHHSCRGHTHGATSLATDEDRAPWYDPWHPQRSDSAAHVAGDERNAYIAVAETRSARQPTTRHRHSSKRAPDDVYDMPRFSLYRDALRQTQTCFVSRPLESGPTAADPDFYDQAVRFRVVDQTCGHRENGATNRETEMIVVSSPGNIPSVVETLAPLGSGRRVVIRARTPQGIIQHGDLQFLANILPQGWAFDLVLEDE